MEMKIGTEAEAAVSSLAVSIGEGLPDPAALYGFARLSVAGKIVEVPNLEHFPVKYLDSCI